MRINPIANRVNGFANGVKQNPVVSKDLPADTVSFRNYNPAGARRIEQELARKGISCDFKNNEFVGECVQKVVKVFEDLFGRSWLPERVSMETINKKRLLAAYTNLDNKVYINQLYNDRCYKDMKNLRKSARGGFGYYIFPDSSSSLHPAHTFVHEFSHCAHWHHLKDRNGFSNAWDTWKGLKGVVVPTAIGRLITRYKLSDYAIDGDDMCEFMAERMSQDICNSLTDNLWVKYKHVDVDYHNIFSRKWNYRYSSPQSYIDYFTQQVWNGDIDGANNVGDDAARYLAEIESERVAPIAQTIENITENIPILGGFGRFISGLSRNLTDSLNEKNKIQLHE